MKDLTVRLFILPLFLSLAIAYFSSQLRRSITQKWCCKKFWNNSLDIFTIKRMFSPIWKKIALHFAFFSSFEYYIFICRTPIFLSVLERLQLNGGFSFLKASSAFFLSEHPTYKTVSIYITFLLIIIIRIILKLFYRWMFCRKEEWKQFSIFNNSWKTELSFHY